MPLGPPEQGGMFGHICDVLLIFSFDPVNTGAFRLCSDLVEGMSAPTGAVSVTASRRGWSNSCVILFSKVQYRVNYPIEHHEDDRLLDFYRTVSQGEFHSEGQSKEDTVHSYPSTWGPLPRCCERGDPEFFDFPPPDKSCILSIQMLVGRSPCPR